MIYNVKYMQYEVLKQLMYSEVEIIMNIPFNKKLCGYPQIPISGTSLIKYHNIINFDSIQIFGAM